MRKLPELVRRNQRKTSDFDRFTLYELKTVAEPETETRGPELLRHERFFRLPDESASGGL
ncbi:MAG: hypothetical protein CVV64_18620 [Candidatus Wallbacteria bacterium HGW-Wallbacteria-1]|uniref:Uncharacterized protein n=1 Tax=Candidatus Wallbacteria bacterium HGW-Wallbacteria-1 TaxID=2013854 RepID=A0A2N1PJE8_9BACT|nr:MAG: hypothetical protein CVV64_18620 [Candidatus Wallbacteria bacterium HGW-Wallbacteria-1]